MHFLPNIIKRKGRSGPYRTHIIIDMFTALSYDPEGMTSRMQGVGAIIILKLIINVLGWGVWIGFIWPGVGTSWEFS